MIDQSCPGKQNRGNAVHVVRFSLYSSLKLGHLSEIQHLHWLNFRSNQKKVIASNRHIFPLYYQRMKEKLNG